nr:hypothetical protein [Tanacetum cinerariifolium]
MKLPVKATTRNRQIASNNCLNRDIGAPELIIRLDRKAFGGHLAQHILPARQPLAVADLLVTRRSGQPQAFTIEGVDRQQVAAVTGQLDRVHQAVEYQRHSVGCRIIGQDHVRAVLAQRLDVGDAQFI